MHSIGNDHDASVILKWVRECDDKYGRPDCAWTEEAPKGWSYIGSGSFRSVWLSPEGVAYKVGHRPHDYQSMSEVINLERAWKEGAPAGCRLPKFSAYYPNDETVVAVEMIRGETLCASEDRRSPGGVDYYDLMWDVETLYGLSDMHDENVVIDEDGLLVPIDFGE